MRTAAHFLICKIHISKVLLVKQLGEVQIFKKGAVTFAKGL